MTSDLDRSEALASAATPGPWISGEYEGPRGRTKIGVRSIYYEDEEPGICGDLSKHWPLTEQDADFIAAHSPDVILWMVAELRLLREIEQKRTRVMPGSNCEICGYADHSEECPYKRLDALRKEKT